MGKIIYSINGTYAPFGVELRQNNLGGLVIRDEVKETVGTYEFDNVPNGNYVIVIYDNAGGFEVSDLITLASPTTTTTTTTTLPPNPPLFVALRPATGGLVTNTNDTLPNPSNNLHLFITTDPQHTQNPDTGSFSALPPQLFSPVAITLNISGANNGHRVTSVGGSNGSPQNVTIGNSWSSNITQNGIILPVGFRYGYIEIGARTTLGSPDNFTVIVSSASNPFGLASNSPVETPNLATDTEYVLKGSNTYGYTNISFGSITITKAVEDGGIGGGSEGF